MKSFIRWDLTEHNNLQPMLDGVSLAINVFVLDSLIVCRPK